MITAFSLSRICPVSYTHLDVYKRQVYAQVIIIGVPPVFPCKVLVVICPPFIRADNQLFNLFPGQGRVNLLGPLNAVIKRSMYLSLIHILNANSSTGGLFSGEKIFPPRT